MGLIYVNPEGPGGNPDPLLAAKDIRAPFAGLIAERHIKFAEHVTNGDPLFRISDFDPLECPIQVPEKDLARLRVGHSSGVSTRRACPAVPPPRWRPRRP